MQRPRIAITMGDPAGIGPEICLRLLMDEQVREACTPIIFGERAVLDRVARHLGWRQAAERMSSSMIESHDAIAADSVRPGVANPDTGRAAYTYIDSAIEKTSHGQVDAVVTGPVNKRAINQAGILFPGHTELFASRTGSTRWCMMLTSPEITCSLVTAHVGYREVAELLSVERILEVIGLSHDTMLRLRGRTPRLAVCGLNPHAGEEGLFGEQEEERFIQPAIEAARARGIQVRGSLPPDTAFVARHRREIDCFVCMYHDQGLIPLKALAFDHAVNITLGLPLIRTSVDHGTALDIAWQGVATATSLIEAVQLAARLARSQRPASAVDDASLG